jgi:hypothetical protein
LHYREIEDKLFTEYQISENYFYLLSYAEPSDYGENGQIYTSGGYYDSYPFLTDPSGLISFYSRFLTIFANNNDDESYNACYQKLKSIQKTASMVEYKNSPNLESYFEWKMNEFLETFCDYGTKPVKALVFSVWVIAIFCIIYIIFPSEPDNLSYDKLTGAVTRYIHHFANHNSISNEADLIYESESKAITTFKEELHTNQHKLPPIIVSFGRPLHRFMEWVAKIKYRIQSIIEFNIFNDWHSLTSRQKWKTSAIITLSLIGFLSWGVLVRLLNAIALSMNAFVTLGYGEIEASGIARYFCVLEGLVGWFLLSIFSVSLISQILQ